MRNPFVGLRPFQSDEDDLFFGRDRDIAIMQNLVLALPVLVVYAPSGTGKSSLLNAGLLPTLQRDGTLLPIVVTDPRDDVLQRVRDELASKGWVDHGAPGNGRGGLAQLLERHFSATDRRVILVLDQFEERLKQGGALEGLYGEIARLANTSSDAATVVISIREDYLAGLERLMRRVTGLLDASYRVPNLSRPALTEAVRGPLAAVRAEVTVDDGLVDEVLTDLERETHLPEALDGRIEAGYFQIVWSHLWDADVKDRGDRLTRATYVVEGRAAGILKSFVAETLNQLLPFEAEVLRAAIRYLVLPTGAKVPLTVDDLVGLLRPDDYTSEGRELLSSFEQQDVRGILATVLQSLTRTDAPLFRRAVRGGREEFELVHDLLGPILITWRGEREAAQRADAKQLVGEVFGRGGLEHALNQSPRLAEKSALYKLHLAEEGLEVYLHSLATVKTGDDAERNGRTLRSVFAYVASWLREAAPTPTHRPAFDTFRERLIAAEMELRRAALRPAPWEVRRVLQRQAYEFLAMRRHLDDSRWPLAYGGLSGWALLVRNSVAWLVGLLLAIAGLAGARWAVGQGSPVPDVEYIPLTLAVIAVGAATLYTSFYSIAARGAALDWRAARTTLWPVYRRYAYAVQTVSSGDSPALLQASGVRRYLPAALRAAVSIPAWWPVHYLVLELGCFAGARLFELAGWAPTPGFNLAGLVFSLVLAVWYGVAAASSTVY